MNWQAIGAVGELAAAVAVVASLIFVGYQLRQSRFIEKANAQRDLLVQAREWMSILASDEELFDSVRTCLNDFNESEPLDKERFSSWAFNLLFLFEQVYYMRMDGFVNDGSFNRFEQATLSLIRTKGGDQWWKLAYNIVGTDVGEYLAARLEEIGDSVPPWDDLLPHLKLGSGDA